MKITKHKLSTTEHEYNYKKTPNTGNPFEEGLPDTIVIHYTAGNSITSSVNWLTNPEARASAHLVIGKEGEIYQLAPFNIITWHAGRSSWKGRGGLNKYSIGIELENSGYLIKKPDGYCNVWDKKIPEEKIILATHANEKKERAWESYTQLQLETLEKVCLVLIKQYEIKEVVGHDEISPGRKQDPGPAFAMDKFREKMLIGRDSDDSIKVNGKGLVTANYLNIRREPAASGSLVTEPLPAGTKLEIMEEQNGWLKVKADISGWVSSKWVKRF